MSESRFLTYDQHMMALCLWREARSHPQAYRAIKHVLINRAHRTGAAIPWHLVILERGQFATFSDNNPNSSLFPVDDGSLDWKAWQEAQRVTTDNTTDPTNGATHFHTNLVPEQFPKWARGRTPTTIIGSFKFYRL